MSSNSNQRIFTWSFWLKRSGLGSTQYFAGVGGGGGYASAIYFDSNDQLETWNYFNSSYAGRYKTNRKFRDTNAWYHIMLAVDTTLATAGDRIKIYVNGVQETSFATSDNPNQNQTWEFNSASVHEIGRNASHSFNGSMSHVIFVDGTQLTPSTFGSTDSTTGEWKINTSPSPTWGTNGFWLLKDGNVITDSSTNSNDFTVGAGTLTKTEDCPSNVFATLNPLMHFRQPTPLLYGNTGIENGDTQWENGYGTIATPTTGKFYAEFKYPAFGGTSYGHAGIIAVDDIATQASGYLNFGDAANSWSISVTDGSVYNNGSSIATYSSISANGIIGLAIDCTNSKLYISVNGTWQNSADPSSGTGGISITSNKEYFVGGKVYNAYINANFGNGYFGTTAVSSAGTNASNNGIFEYDVPTGYTALSTKGLNL
jgi:hypothetical protein